MLFQDRENAGEQLAEALSVYRGQNPLILAIPRGGVILGRVIARDLGGELNLLLVRKIGHPHNPEFAVAAVNEDGTLVYTDPSIASSLDKDYFRSRMEEELERIQRYRIQFGKDLPPPNPQGRVVIVVDDGIATGATMLAGLKALRKHNPQKLIAAVPVAPREARIVLTSVADEVVILYEPENFYAVGQFYERFDPVEDSQVISCLKG